MDTPRTTQSFPPDEVPGPSQHLQPGTNLANRYLIESVIGFGGMGAVYRARDLHFPNITKLVAVKEMFLRTPDPLVRKTIVRNFEREANLLATLDHRAIPRIYDYFTINERSYLVLEYIAGRDLEAVLSTTQDFLPEARVVGWALELCDVLEYLHTRQPDAVIFRDMKPSNIMINVQDHVVLVDFGIARQFEIGQKGTVIGTEGYSPPEQYRGDATPQADIYALGATMHHLLTRQDPRLEPPFSFIERPIRPLNPAVSAELEKVIYKALAYNPNERYASAGEFREALLSAARQTGILSPASTNAARPVMGEGIKPVWVFDCEDEVRASPLVADGVVYIGSYDHNLYALNSQTGSFIWKYPTEGGIAGKPAIQENNLYIGSADHRLHVIQARTGRVNWTYFTHGPVWSSPHIAEGHVFIGSDDHMLHAVNTFTSRRAWEVDMGAPVRSSPLVSQEAVYCGTEAGELLCLDFRGGIRWRFKARRAISGAPVAARGMVYAASLDSNLYALDARTGWVVWRFRMSKGSISTPCLVGDLLFCGAIDGTFYCIDAANSREVWHFNSQNQITGSPVADQDSIYFASVDGFLYCLELRGGRMRWKFRTQGPITGTPAVADGLAYIGSTDHRVYAVMA